MPTHDCQPRLVARRRPPRYHTPRSASPWLTALRRLWALGLTDARVADLLSALSADDIRALALDGWTVERAEDLAGLGTDPVGPPWTPRQVRHHRERLGLLARSDGLTAARAERAYRRRRHQSDEGWGHLLPSTDAKAGGICLCRCEVRVLCLLRDAGPMTRRQLLEGLGHMPRAFLPHWRPMMNRLVGAGVLLRERQDGGRTRYALTEWAKAAPHANGLCDEIENFSDFFAGRISGEKTGRPCRTGD